MSNTELTHEELTRKVKSFRAYTLLSKHISLYEYIKRTTGDSLVQWLSFNDISYMLIEKASKHYDFISDKDRQIMKDIYKGIKETGLHLAVDFNENTKTLKFYYQSELIQAGFDIKDGKLIKKKVYEDSSLGTVTIHDDFSADKKITVSKEVFRNDKYSYTKRNDGQEYYFVYQLED